MIWPEVFERLRALAEDREHGARELALAAARAVREGAESSATGGSEAQGIAPRLARAIVSAQPEMAPFYHLGARVLAAATREAIAAAAAEFERALEDGSLEREVRDRLPGRCTVATYSRSGSVLAALIDAHGAGKRVRAVVAEGRPAFEGRTVAAELAAAGIEVEFLTDAAFLGRLGSADLVMLGADAVGRRAFTNKVGSGAVCAIARAASRPVLVLADVCKLLPEEFWPSPEDRSGDEVWDQPPARVSVRNPYFEAVSLDGVDAVVTGGGSLDAALVAERVEGVARRLEPLRSILPRGPGQTPD